MRVSAKLSDYFTQNIEKMLSSFCFEYELIPEMNSLSSQRYLTRSVVPHLGKLSSTFNRMDGESNVHSNYWKNSSHPKNLRAAYFLYFMPQNLFRMAAVWNELYRLGFQWPKGQVLRGIELGAGAASGVCGLALAESFHSCRLPVSATWDLYEKNRSILQLGKLWTQNFVSNQDWEIRTRHKTLDEKAWLEKRDPRYNLWLMSFFLNELEQSPEDLAGLMLKTWKNHLEKEGVVIIVEPALRTESRKLLELRKLILEKKRDYKLPDLNVVLPCRGNQSCGALAKSTDWCHENVSWWRPDYIRKLDDLLKLDHKTLDFSFLILVNSKRPIQEWLTKIPEPSTTYRLVSPSRRVGSDHEFYMCGETGKHRTQMNDEVADQHGIHDLQRGDFLRVKDLKKGHERSRVHSAKKIIPVE